VSVSQVARITGMSHRCLAPFSISYRSVLLAAIISVFIYDVYLIFLFLWYWGMNSGPCAC
jgi:hypothetical protein